MGRTSTNDGDAEVLAECLKVLSHPLRIRILDELSEGERCVSELSRKIGVSQTNISQHLTLLRYRGWVKRKKEAIFVYYSLSDKEITSALVKICEIIHHFHSYQ